MRKKPNTSGAANRNRSHKALSDVEVAIIPLSLIGIEVPMWFYFFSMRDHSATGVPLARIFSGRWKLFHPCTVGRFSGPWASTVDEINIIGRIVWYARKL